MKSVNKPFKRFLLLWAGEWISSIGSGLTAFALGIYVFQTTQSATGVSLITLCAFLPTILLSPFAGVLADRHDRRLMMILGDSCSALGLVYIVIMMMTGHVELWQLCFGVTVSSIFASLMEPAYKATITDLLDEEQFAKASGLVQLAASSKYLLSPVIAGLLLTVTGINAILLIDIATFFVTVSVTLAVKRSIVAPAVRTERQSYFKELAHGWHTLTENKGVILLVLLITVVTFCMGFLQTLFTPMLLPLADAKTLGISESICACGMLVTSLALGIWGKKQNLIQMLCIGLCGAGVFMALTGCATNIVLITAAGFLFFASLPFINTSADVLVRTNIAGEAQGRVWGLIGVISQAGFVVAYAISGFLADAVFNPLLASGGALSQTVGKVIGIGNGRGIGLMLIVLGLPIVVLAVIAFHVKAIRNLVPPIK